MPYQQDRVSSYIKPYTENALSKSEFEELFTKAFKEVQGRLEHKFMINHTEEQQSTRGSDKEQDSIFTFGIEQFNEIQFNCNQQKAISKPFLPNKPIHHKQTQILEVKNLPINTSPQHLFQLFSVYGNVFRIFMPNYDRALIAYQTIEQAQLAI